MKQSGFTLIELVVAIVVGSIVAAFVGMILTAPVDAYEAQSRRQAMVGDLNAAWPRIQLDLAEALPNSVRARPNGNYVALEFMPVVGVTRYTGTANINSTSIAVAGTPAGVIRGQAANASAPIGAYLSVNPDVNVYTRTGSITNAPRTLSWTTSDAVNGTGTISILGAPPNFTAGDSPRRRLYLVDGRGPVTYLCDLTQGTLRRYSGYTIAASQASRDSPNEFGTATGNELIARGLTDCDFGVHGGGSTAAQTVTARFSTTRSVDNVTLLHTSRAEYLP